nr:hypothetical protein [Cognatiyoonia koreensis]
MVFSMSAAVDAQTELMMAEEPGCIWCARWNAEIATAYPKTPEGIAAPLRRVDISDTLPEDITLARRINFTPTFILLVDGAEVARLEGYAGEDFFWGLLGKMLDDHGVAFTDDTSG